MKKVIFSLLACLLIYTAQAQVGPSRVETQNNTGSVDQDLNLIPESQLSPGEKLFLDEAADVYVQYVRVVQGVPKGRYNMRYIDDFIDRRFTLDAFIEIEEQNHSTTPRPVRRYFSNLVGRYYGSRATLDSSSAIKCKTVVNPQFAIANNGDRVVVCYYDHIMIDKKNGIQVRATDSTPKRVKIIFTKTNNSPTARISNVKVVRP